MLVVTRKLNERIKIGDDVTITVIAVRGGQVKIGIDAPPEVKVHREEVYDRIQRGDPPPTSHEHRAHAPPDRKILPFTRPAMG